LEDRRAFLHRFLPRVAGLMATLSVTSRWAEAILPLDAPAPAASSLKLDDPRYAGLIKELSKKHQFDPKELKAAFEKVVLQPDIIQKFERPAEILPFYEYRKRFINNELIAQGRAYLHENLKLLQAVEDEFGVQKEIVCGILGVETKFGQRGIEKYRAFDILNTAYSLYPRREVFYREQLINYFLLCREEGIDPFSVNSSYAGAFGVPQFMPSSFRKFSVDYDQDGKKDLWNSKADIFASVANYLKLFGWKRNGLTHLPANLPQDSPEIRKSLEKGIRKTISVATAVQLGVQITPPTENEEEVSFTFYQPQEGTESLLALFGNFRAITHYNFSVNYALTVIDLSEIFTKRKTL
jgi:membrane-bound lytic murein transglycosylase B